jgi:hypothetical protein
MTDLTRLADRHFGNTPDHSQMLAGEPGLLAYSLAGRLHNAMMEIEQLIEDAATVAQACDRDAFDSYADRLGELARPLAGEMGEAELAYFRSTLRSQQHEPPPPPPLASGEVPF